jgi:hypothetical protein
MKMRFLVCIFQLGCMLSARGNRRCHIPGLKIAFGSDFTGQHGTNAREMEVMVRYGMAPMAVHEASGRLPELLQERALR